MRIIGAILIAAAIGFSATAYAQDWSQRSAMWVGGGGTRPVPNTLVMNTRELAVGDEIARVNREAVRTGRLSADLPWRIGSHQGVIPAGTPFFATTVGYVLAAGAPAPPPRPRDDIHWCGAQTEGQTFCFRWRAPGEAEIAVTNGRLVLERVPWLGWDAVAEPRIVEERIVLEPYLLRMTVSEISETGVKVRYERSQGAQSWGYEVPFAWGQAQGHAADPRLMLHFEPVHDGAGAIVRARAVTAERPAQPPG